MVILIVIIKFAYSNTLTESCEHVKDLLNYEGTHVCCYVVEHVSFAPTNLRTYCDLQKSATPLGMVLKFEGGNKKTVLGSII